MEEKIVVRTPNWVGDAIHSLVVLNYLSKIFGKMVIICKQNLKDIFEGYGEIITFRDKKDYFKKAWFLRKRRFDWGLVIPISFSSAFGIFLTNAKNRVGFSFDSRDLFLTYKVKIPKWWKERHTIYTLLLLLKPFGIKVDFDVVHPEYKGKIEDKEVRRPSVALGPWVGTYKIKEWGISNYVELAKLLIKEGYWVYVFGMGQGLVFPFKNEKLINLVNKTTLKDVLGYLKKMDWVVGNDGGFIHLASLVSKRIIGIYGPSSPIWTSPLVDKHQKIFILYDKLKCSPCDWKNKYKCPYVRAGEPPLCFKNLTPQKIYEIIKNET